MTMRLSPHVSLTKNDDGAVLLDERRGDYWQLNHTGTAVLDTLLAGGTPADAARVLADDHPVPADRARDDVTALIDSLRSARLVETS
ncbi:lasso peptide biosynthesis PqqD family chaperone [Streptomyces sp. NPDC042319]|uniref:lasso peptide biosynthesis PqqD family chaperone n=1 Tax=Streptomyces sp. NPDC042319 TaxID=3154332 RepID=UPI0033D6208E